MTLEDSGCTRWEPPHRDSVISPGFCSVCELIARALRAGGIKFVDWDVEDAVAHLVGLHCILEHISLLDYEEETADQGLDLQTAEISLQAVLSSISWVHLVDDSWHHWMVRFRRFIKLERKVASVGYDETTAADWYRHKPVDLQFAAYLIWRRLSYGDAAARALVRSRLARFMAIEVFDDIKDSEHRLLWTGGRVEALVRFGHSAERMTPSICRLVHTRPRIPVDAGPGLGSLFESKGG